MKTHDAVRQIVVRRRNCVRRALGQFEALSAEEWRRFLQRAYQDAEGDEFTREWLKQYKEVDTWNNRSLHDARRSGY